MMITKTVKSFKYKIYENRVVVEQKTVKPLSSNKLLENTSIVRLSILLDEADNVNEIQRLYRLANDIIQKYKCCFVLLSEIAQTRLRYKLEIL